MKSNHFLITPNSKIIRRVSDGNWVNCLLLAEYAHFDFSQHRRKWTHFDGGFRLGVRKSKGKVVEMQKSCLSVKVWASVCAPGGKKRKIRRRKWGSCPRTCMKWKRARYIETLSTSVCWNASYLFYKTLKWSFLCERVDTILLTYHLAALYYWSRHLSFIEAGILVRETFHLRYSMRRDIWDKIWRVYTWM